MTPPHKKRAKQFLKGGPLQGFLSLLDRVGGPLGQIQPGSDQSWTLSVGPSGPGLASDHIPSLTISTRPCGRPFGPNLTWL